MVAKAWTIQEMTDSPEEVFKFVRLHDAEYGWFWRFSHIDVDHKDMVDKEEVPLSAGFIFVTNGNVTFPEEINLPNYSTTLGINASTEDRKSIPLLFGGNPEVINGKYVKNGIRGDNDSPADGNEGEHGSIGS